MRLGEPAGGAGMVGRGVGSTHASLALSPSPARSPSPSPWPLPGAASSYTCRRIPMATGAVLSVPACLRSSRHGNLPELRPPPADKDTTEASHGSRCPRAQPAPSRHPGLRVRPDHSLPSLAFAWGARSYRGAFQGLTDSSQPAVLWEVRPPPRAPLSHPEAPCM